MNPLISIIMPAYNSANVIRKTLISVLDQTYKNFELIIVDDCSNDNTVEIINKFEDKRIILIKLKVNLGVSNARNIALDKSKGQFIAFIDSDDLWFSDKLKLQIQFMLLNNYSFTFHPLGFISHNGNYLGRPLLNKTKINFNGLLRNTLISTSSVVVKSDLFKSLRFPNNNRSGEDYYMWLTLLKKVKYAYSLNKTLGLYRKNNISLSSNRKNNFKKVYLIQTTNFAIPKMNAYINTVFYIINAVIKHYILIKND